MEESKPLSGRDILIGRVIADKGNWAQIFADMKIKAPQDPDEIERLVRGNKRNVVTILDADAYPKQMLNVTRSPFAFFCEGDKDLLKTPRERILCVAGDRDPTDNALRYAKKMGEVCARRGIVICAKPSKGIGAETLLSCAKAGGKCIVVHSAGIDQPYPKDVCEPVFAAVLSAGGAIVSEYPDGTVPKAEAMPASNRIVGGLGKALFVPLAKPRSGSMITVAFALNAGLDVATIPTDADPDMPFYNNSLIKDGAFLVEDVEDFIEEEYPDASR